LKFWCKAKSRLGLAHTVEWCLATTSNLHDRSVLGRCEVQLSQAAILDVVQDVAVDAVGDSFAFELEHNHTSVVASSKKFKFGCAAKIQKRSCMQALAFCRSKF
jgi:hypothetical protein